MPNIPNTTIVETDLVYRITPNAGYVIHSKTRDWTDLDPETGEETFYRGYGRGTMSIGKNYDFSVTTEIDGYTAYGAKEIFARPETEVPDNQIFGGGNNDHEVM